MGETLPWIVEVALKKRTKRFVLEGEAGILGIDGISHSGKLKLHDVRALFYQMKDEV